MKKYTKLVVLLITIAICYIASVSDIGGAMGIKKENALYNRLLKSEKEKGWKMLTQTGERVEPSYKELFEICSFDFKNNKKIDIPLYKAGEWGLKNITYALSPDGKDIAFVISDVDVANKTYNSLYSLCLLHIEKGEIETIFPSQQFPRINSVSYAPNGEDIFFVGKLEYVEEASGRIPQFDSLYKLNLQTKEITEMVKFGVGAINAQSCSADGKKIVYESSNIQEIYVYDSTSKSSYKLADGVWPTWSPTDKIIAFYGLDENYYLINPDGTNKKLFINNEPLSKKQDMPKGGAGECIDKIYGELLWSPDGKYIYFERAAVDSPVADTEYYIAYIMDVETKQEIRFPASGIKSWVGQE